MSDTGVVTINDLVNKFFEHKMMNVKGPNLNTDVVVEWLLKLKNSLPQDVEIAEQLKKYIDRFFINENIDLSKVTNEQFFGFISLLKDKIKEELGQQFKSCQTANAQYHQYCYGS